MPKLLMILAPENFRDEGYFIPRQIFEENDIEVTAASTTLNPVSKFEKTISIKSLIGEIEENDFDGIILVGGQGGEVYYENEKVLNLIKEFYNQQKLVAAICMAPSILAKTGILAGKKVTCHNSYKDHVIAAGAEYIEESVVADENIITGFGPKAAKDFAEKIVEYLKI